MSQLKAVNAEFSSDKLLHHPPSRQGDRLTWTGLILIMVFMRSEVKAIGPQWFSLLRYDTFHRPGTVSRLRFQFNIFRNAIALHATPKNLVYISRSSLSKLGCSI